MDKNGQQENANQSNRIGPIDPKTPKVSGNRAYMGIIAGYMGINCHICIQMCPLGRGGIQGC